MTGTRTALVTGASGGLGAAFAAELAARGYALVLTARGRDRLEALAAGLRERHGGEVAVLPADLTEPAGLAAVEERLAAGTDLLVNNAGTFGGVAPFAVGAVAAEEHKIALNVVATVRLTRAALPPMVGRGSGGILNVSSVAGFLNAPGGAVYCATKAFVTSFTETVRAETTGLGVSVTVLCPGATRTDARPGRRSRLGPLLDPAFVVRAGLDALAAGRPLCVPGLEYKSRVLLARHMPRGLTRTIFHRGWGRSQASVAKEANS
ncbi:SDR family NAD(P)-dependent oxidoreductase [Rhizohabitans arisaemae]|uniref:SDR family NAD(P)-dependent oxidoreductase n=1 Tax=Rhizohabitans arisaemae TaxID=2720610 RepID=UPI0024B0A8C0|nr:SDR family NAD(P)-dependent oxidoreductase [Rhizohabitans arisaemae]